MAKIRSFILQNAAGGQWDLNGADGVFLESPEGLGARWKVSTADLGGGFFQELAVDTVPADPIAGDLCFLPPDAYACWRRFIAFTAAAADLRLLYCPYGSETYLCRGRFELLQKGELEGGGVLRVPVSFVPFTPWFLPKQQTLAMAGENDDAMKFPFTFSEDLVFPESNAGDWAAEITAAGHQAAALRFSFSAGSLLRPSLTVTGVNSGTVYGVCQITGDALVAGLEYSSVPGECWIRDGSGNDLCDRVSPGTDPYLRIPLGEPCTFALGADDDISGTASVTVYTFWRSV